MEEIVVPKTEPLEFPDLKIVSNDASLDQIGISRFNDPVDPDLDLIEPKFENCEALFKKSETEVPENLVENGEKNKPFICASCDKGLALKQYLTEHIKSVHEGWKPCPCSICDGKCIYSSKLKSHPRAVHEKKKLYKFSKCDFSSGLRYSLIRHYDTVHEKKMSFPCTVCNRCGKKHYVTMTKEQIETTHFSGL